MRFIQLRSAPAQKAGPVPARTMQRTSGRAPYSATVAESSAITSSLKALRTSGRLSVTVAMPASKWSSRCFMLGSSIPFRDFLEHHLGRAAADRQHARVAPKPLDGRLADVAHAAEKLLAGLHDLVDELASKRLEHRHILNDVVALRHAPCTVIHELPGRTRLRVEHRQPLADRLLVPPLAAEGFALAHIVERDLQRARAVA